MRMVVNHLRFREPVPDSVIEAANDVARRIVDAGALGCSIVLAEPTHAILVISFPDLETEDRIKSEIGGPWMNEHVVPLLGEPTDRSSGEVVAHADG